jgi:hypothetical protein
MFEVLMVVTMNQKTLGCGKRLDDLSASLHETF